jgi:septation ring formation regulator EzrA
MADQTIDYSPVYDFLYRIDKRITSLEKDAAYIETQVNNLGKKRITDFDNLSTELKNFKSDISSIKSIFNKCIMEMIGLSKDLKTALKKEEFESLNTKLDEVKFEEYLTSRDLIRGV